MLMNVVGFKQCETGHTGKNNNNECARDMQIAQSVNTHSQTVPSSLIGWNLSLRFRAEVGACDGRGRGRKGWERTNG